MPEFFDQDDLSEYDLERESLNDSEPPLEPGESIFFGGRMRCGWCGHISMPWPTQVVCAWCGQEPKVPERPDRVKK